MGWPSEGAWLARADGARVRVGGKTWRLQVVDCGQLVLPTGRLVACDPFAGLQADGNPYVQVPPGSYPVMVTLADVGGEEDGSHLREAYASLLLSAEPEVRRAVLELGPAGESLPRLGPGEFVGFPVDAGTACLVDGGAVETAMPKGDWYEDLFETGKPDSWFARMDDPAHIRAGIANISLPLARNGENLVLFHSGWDDGVYPVVGGYDAAGEMVAVHVDLLVIEEDAELLPAG